MASLFVCIDGRDLCCQGRRSDDDVGNGIILLWENPLARLLSNATPRSANDKKRGMLGAVDLCYGLID